MKFTNMNPSLRLAAAIALAIAMAATSACTEPGASSEETAAAGDGSDRVVRLSYTGCGITRKAFMGELVTAFTAKTGIEVDVSGGGATKGIVNSSAGNADLGGGCRHKLPGPEEANAVQHHVAWDALVAIVHPDNPVENLSSTELRNALTGQLVDWSAVGGPPGEIVVAARSGKISGVGRMVRELIFNDPSADYTTNSIIYPSTGPLEQAIENSPRLIGVTGISSANKRNVKILSIDGVAPTYENVASGRYPYTRPLYIYVNAEASSVANSFVEFARSPEGQEIIRAQGTVNLADGQALKGIYRQKMASLGLDPALWEL